MCDSLNLTLHSVHKNQTACGRSCLSSRCFCLTSFPSVLSLVSIHPGRCKTILFTFSFDASILHVALHRLISSLIFFEISGMHVFFFIVHQPQFELARDVSAFAWFEFIGRNSLVRSRDSLGRGLSTPSAPHFSASFKLTTCFSKF